MLTSTGFIPTSAPPPQSVIEKRNWWTVLSFLLLITLLLRTIGADVAGGLLTAVMLFFAIMISRDGMVDLGRYALIYGVMSLMNFMFDVLLLAYTLGGRTETEISDVEEDGDDVGVYSITSRTYAFFDMSRGIQYNCISLAMLISPVAMLLGAYLALTAHQEIQRTTEQTAVDDEDERFEIASNQSRGYGALGRGDSSVSRSQITFERFLGSPYKLDM
eukprot:TRINITY_DN3980_c0_g1_i1.p1 TRINITY_DN3980_c0_g1~~TRINITY_DN3980_c0_g1_i1.p1  ORF type:complete len:218 (-),score=24.22 TRINITY_DN3980_c0_g1_i1:91-744(-)